MAPDLEERGRTISIWSDTRLICYPNPVSGDFSIAFESAVETSGQIQIRDINGKTVYAGVVAIAPGKNLLQIPESGISSAPAGVLTMSLSTPEFVKTARIIKK